VVKVDFFEYGCVYLRFVKNKSKSKGLLNLAGDGFIVAELYIDGEKKIIEEPIGEEGCFSMFKEKDSGLFGELVTFVERNFCLRVLSEFLSRLGREGWEVIEYKTNNDPAFGQALLKRKVNK
jgi:hypothetical protein